MKVKLRPPMDNLENVPRGVRPGYEYLVLGIEADDYRLLNDEAEPVLYDLTLFDIVDDQEPSNWIHHVGPDGEHYAYPPELNARGFFEDYHDGVPASVETFRRFLSSLNDK
ncbi:MAG: hypothetical protein LLG01_12505 [Planctomycetaceae bacterium]|nr:hypothetical protein [Planctomycetaceae bacterium]